MQRLAFRHPTKRSYQRYIERAVRREKLDQCDHLWRLGGALDRKQYAFEHAPPPFMSVLWPRDRFEELRGHKGRGGVRPWDGQTIALSPTASRWSQWPSALVQAGDRLALFDRD